jgi:hypothetical protein
MSAVLNVCDRGGDRRGLEATEVENVFVAA